MVSLSHDNQHRQKHEKIRSTSATASPALKATPASFEMMLIQELPFRSDLSDDKISDGGDWELPFRSYLSDVNIFYGDYHDFGDKVIFFAVWDFV